MFNIIITSELHIKTTVRYLLTPNRMAIINKSTNNKFGEGVEKKNPFALLVEMQVDAATVENSMEFS